MKKINDYLDGGDLTNLPTLENLDDSGIDLEAEKEEQIVSLERCGLINAPPKADLFEEMPSKCANNFYGEVEQGRKLCKIIGIIIIAISIASMVNTFFTGDFGVFLGSAFKIFACIELMRGKKLWRWVLILSLAVSIYAPFVLLFVVYTDSSTFMRVVYSLLIIGYGILEVILCKSKSIKTFLGK